MRWSRLTGPARQHVDHRGPAAAGDQLGGDEAGALARSAGGIGPIRSGVVGRRAGDGDDRSDRRRPTRGAAPRAPQGRDRAVRGRVGADRPRRSAGYRWRACIRRCSTLTCRLEAFRTWQPDAGRIVDIAGKAIDPNAWIYAAR
jgi:hypothetical protein